MLCFLVTIDVGKVFLLDYRFIGKPAFNPQHFLETYHKVIYIFR